MGRVALTKNIKLTIAALIAVLLVAGAGGVAYVRHVQADQAQTVTNSQHQLTQISYHGHDGVDALTLLKQKAAVQVKHYSFGDQVISINGTSGNGPKYWTFYINNKEATVGAGAYTTKDGDTLTWRLQ